MKIRSIEKKDYQSCLDIYNYYILNTCYTLEEDKLFVKEFSTRIETILKKYPFIVYENDDQEVLGYAYLNSFNTRSAYKISADLSIYVNKDHLKEKIGSFLFDSIVKLAPFYKIKNIISIVTSENKNSFNFHLKNGFVLEGTIHNVAIKFNKLISVYYFRKEIV